MLPTDTKILYGKSNSGISANIQQIKGSIGHIVTDLFCFRGLIGMKMYGCVVRFSGSGFLFIIF